MNILPVQSILSGYRKLQITYAHVCESYTWPLIPTVCGWGPGAVYLLSFFGTIRLRPTADLSQYIHLPITVLNAATFIVMEYLVSSAPEAKSRKLLETLTFQLKRTGKSWKGKIDRRVITSFRGIGIRDEVGDLDLAIGAGKTMLVLVDYLITLLVAYPQHMYE